MKRILGLDIGEKRTGVALSDPLGITAQPFDCWQGDPKSEDFLAFVEKIIDEKKVNKIVVGLPKNLKNQDTLSTQRARDVAQMLKEKLEIEIIFWDERLTSSQVGRMFQDMGVKKKKRKEKVDVLAAVLILQNYLDFKGNTL